MVSQAMAMNILWRLFPQGKRGLGSHSAPCPGDGHFLGVIRVWISDLGKNVHSLGRNSAWPSLLRPIAVDAFAGNFFPSRLRRSAA